jgi:hypothetical protein
MCQPEMVRMGFSEAASRETPAYAAAKASGCMMKTVRYDQKKIDIRTEV